MATIQTRNLANGKAYQLRFTRDGKRLSVHFDSAYSLADVELAKRMLENVLTAERHEETPDKLTRTYFESLPLELQQKFSKCGITLARNCESLISAWQRSWRKSTRRPRLARNSSGSISAIVCSDCSTDAG